MLREYALLADGERGALVGPRGDVAWLCAPSWHSDAVFGCLIGGPGVYAVTPDRARFVWGGYYEDGSLIWRSRWVTASGCTECREALGYPGDPDTAVLLRRVLEMSTRPLPQRPADPATAWQATERAWADALPKLGASLAPAGSQHSYAVLTGLTSRSGGMVAAATMSLPERSRAGRNYDYRYVWIRDQCYAGQAVAADGPHRLLDDAVAFVAERVLADGPRLKPAYTVRAARCRTSARCAPWPAIPAARTRPATGSTSSSS